jgi:hypothetical protein
MVDMLADANEINEVLGRSYDQVSATLHYFLHEVA